MANDVKAMYTINNATIFIVATCVVVVSVDPCCISDVSLATSRALWYKRGLNSQQQLINFLVAHVSFLVFLVTVSQIQCAALQQASFFRGFLWLQCLRRLDVTVGYTNVRTCSTI